MDRLHTATATSTVDPAEIRHLTRLFAMSPDLLAAAGFDGLLKHFNDAWEQQLGWPRAVMETKPYLEIVHPDDRAETEVQIGAPGPGRDDRRVRLPDGLRRRVDPLGGVEWRPGPGGLLHRRSRRQRAAGDGARAGPARQPPAGHQRRAAGLRLHRVARSLRAAADGRELPRAAGAPQRRRARREGARVPAPGQRRRGAHAQPDRRPADVLARRQRGAAPRAGRPAGAGRRRPEGPRPGDRRDARRRSRSASFRRWRPSRRSSASCCRT